MVSAKEIIKTVNEVISDRRKRQLMDDLKDFKSAMKSASPADKKTLSSAVEYTEKSLKGDQLSGKERETIFKAIEIAKGE